MSFTLGVNCYGLEILNNVLGGFMSDLIPLCSKLMSCGMSYDNFPMCLLVIRGFESQPIFNSTHCKGQRTLFLTKVCFKGVFGIASSSVRLLHLVPFELISK